MTRSSSAGAPGNGHKRRKETIMKKYATLSLSAALLLSSCGSMNSGTAAGGFMGAQLGSILGSAIGGISDGPRGSDLGTIIGMAGGAAVGAAIGNASDKAQQNKYSQYKHESNRQSAYDSSSSYTTPDSYGNAYAGTDAQDSGFDPNNGGDDVIYDFGGPDYTGNYSASQPQQSPAGGNALAATPAATANALEIRNPRFVDGNKDNVLSAGELCKVIFEVYNNSTGYLYDVQPVVEETTGNKRIYVSSSIHVEKIAPGKGIRYTAMVKADKKLKDGNAHFRLYAKQGRGEVTSPVSEFSIVTRR